MSKVRDRLTKGQVRFLERLCQLTDVAEQVGLSINSMKEALTSIAEVEPDLYPKAEELYCRVGIVITMIHQALTQEPV